ncbi:DUF2225 domain-containing protein [Oscillospiraceae bacterium MB08-C2-2]|nr:DUF2225 domain-containing protein [Oscillospiraceae bacterium MB08-C2-2]
MNIEALLKLSSTKRHRKGAMVAQEGDSTGGELFFLLQGNLGAFQKYNTAEQNQVTAYGPGSFVGEMSLFLNAPQLYTLVALSDVVLLALTRQNISEFFTVQPALTFMLIENICRRATHAESALSELKAQIEAAGKPVTIQSSSQISPLFPEGHGSYLLPLDNENREFFYEREYTCPMCTNTFKNMAVLTSRLKVERTDSDLRVIYKGAEPLHYDTITCPTCLYSSLSEQFEFTSRGFANKLYEIIAPYKADTVMHLKAGIERDTFTVFASYYLTMLCAPVCLDDYQLTTASIWQKLSRLYKDLGDDKMYFYASRRALSDYQYSYEHFKIPDKSLQQLCYIMGDLEERLGNVDTARNYFFMAKTNRSGSPLMKRQSENRLENIRDSLRSK